MEIWEKLEGDRTDFDVFPGNRIVQNFRKLSLEIFYSQLSTEEVLGRKLTIGTG